MEAAPGLISRSSAGERFGDAGRTLAAHGAAVSEILAIDQHGRRLMTLVAAGCSTERARAALAKHKAADLFPNARAPQAALAGLWLYFSAFDECHEIAQAIPTAEGSYWHAIAHRQEPDSGNSAYWFRRVGMHPIFAPLRDAAAEIAARYEQAGFRPSAKWDPYAFIDFVDRARGLPGSDQERAALEIQRAEWQLLFDYCARPAS